MKKHSVILKITAALLLVVLTVLSLSACGGTAAAVDDNGTLENLNWRYESATQTLTISGAGDMKDFSSADEVPWAGARLSAVRIVLGDDVTSIGNYAFYGMTALTEVVLPEAAGEGDPHVLKRVGDFAFAYSTAVTEIKLPVTVQSVGKGAFEGCSALSGIYLHENVSSLGERAFAYCYSMTSAVITGPIAGIGAETFKNCRSLASVVVRTSVDLEAVGEGAFDGAGISVDKITKTDNSTGSSKVTVKYVHEDGTVAAPDFCYSWIYGTPYRIPSPEVEGFAADLEMIEGTADGTDRTATVTYKAVETAESGAVESTPVEAAPTEEKTVSPLTVIAVIVMVVVLIGIGVGAFLLIRADKKTAGKNTTTVRKNQDGKDSKKNKKSGK